MQVTVGGWYPRTTLHLDEVFDFLSEGKAVGLNEKKIQKHLKNLDLKEVRFSYGNIDKVIAKTKNGIVIEYTEDGLYRLSKKTQKPKPTEKEITNYFQDKFNPAISYLFSRGAPTPKVLANVIIKRPTVFSIVDKTHKKHKPPVSFGKAQGKISSKNLTVHFFDNHMYLVGTSEDQVDEVISMQIFFRDFQSQLSKYLQIHRDIWEKVDDLTDAKEIKGSELSDIYTELSEYEKTIILIRNRIKQMSTYISTREELSNKVKVQNEMRENFKYKFEDLKDSLSYIQEIWDMTIDYIKQAIGGVASLQDKATSKSIRSIQVLASIGVLAGALSYFGEDQFPSANIVGATYFFSLIIIAGIINWGIKTYYNSKTYSLTSTQIKKL